MHELEATPLTRAPRRHRGVRVVDVVVVGAGHGGLGAALALSEAGLEVVLVEALGYPGGCAGTFERGGYRFEAGATLVAGLGAGQLFERVLRRYGLELEVETLDPVIELRAAGLRLPLRRDPRAFEAELLALPGAPREAVRRFLRRQRRVADVLWPVLEQPDLLPPFTARALLAHALRAPRMAAALASIVGRDLATVMRRDGVWDFAPLRLLSEAACQITVQCSASEAEAPLALAALDHVHRGAAHIVGGVGRLAWELLRAVEAAGADVHLACRARGIAPTPNGWRVATRHGDFEARAVVANVVPAALGELLGSAPPRLARLGEEVAGGWGACMLYRVVAPPPDAGPEARHLQLVDDAEAPLVEGNHVFVSISGAGETERAPAGLRTITASTHLALGRLRGIDDEERARRVELVQARMRRTIARLAPEWAAEVVHELPASPRTFERFTGRTAGAVGGIPRRAGFSAYRRLGPRAIAPGLYLAGDSVFPGQSALAAATGGLRAAAAVVRDLK